MTLAAKTLWLAGLAAMLSACGGLDSFALGYPEGNGISQILALSTPDSIEVFAYSVDTERDPIVRVLDGGEATVEVAYYDVPLNRLAVREGPVVPAPEGGHLVPREWTELHRTAVGRDGPAGWAQAEVMSKRFSEFLLPGAPFSSCPTVEAEGFILGDDIPNEVIANPKQPEEVLVFTIGAELLAFRFNIESGETIPLALNGLADEKKAITSAAIDTDNTLWLGSTALYRASVSGAQIDLELVDDSLLTDIVDTDTGTASTTYQQLNVDLLPSGGADILTLDTRGRLWRFVAGTKTLVHAFASETDIIKSAGGLVKVGPGEFFASSARNPMAAHLIDGDLEVENVGEGLVSLALLPDYGVVGGGDGGRLSFRNEVGEWRLVTARAAAIVRLMTATSGSELVFGGGNGVLSVFSAGEMCEPFVTTIGGLDSMAQVGDVVVVGGRSARERPENLFVIHFTRL